MLKLNPIRSEKVWGYEDWIASTHPDGLQTDFASLVNDYPLLVKIIQANDTLSVQVHPDDSDAKRLEGENERGKTECWYVLEAEEGASLIYGLKGNLSKEEVRAAIKENSLENLLNRVTVKKGDFIFIPSGTVHAIGGGLRLLEVQQSCNITYRLYDWGRPREVHIEKGVEVIKNEKRTEIAPLAEEFECAYFRLQKEPLKGGYSFLVSPSSKTAELLFISEGNGTIRSTAKDGIKTEMPFTKEEIFAVTSGEKITLEGHGEVIRIQAK
ncbi:type I phosphomannose isomerase catalytic subunit [Treponema sp.]|uniref:type I phosphomannose isomerase catalytic subunit n=1 Tax=Treponema sp. TaxID=166 RepID=UPI00388DA543